MVYKNEYVRNNGVISVFVRLEKQIFEWPI